jgi:tripartite-type tricarboxylate transporter receptor subunit TctC
MMTAQMEKIFKGRFRRGLVSAISAALVLAGAAPTARADPAEFYRGKTIEILVGFSAGGGYDAYARALAAFIGEHIPGKPQVVVRNMTGAGSLRLARYLQDAAPRDGLSFGTVDNGLLVASLIKGDVPFDASKLSWLGSITKDLEVCTSWNKSPVKTLADLQGAETVFGATGRDDIRFNTTEALRNLLGAKIKIVSGYPGTNDIRLAMESGELDGVCESWQSMKATKPEWISEKRINLLVQMGFEPHPDLPAVPLIGASARTPTELEALKLLFAAPSDAGRSFGAPPAVPTDRLAALRRAFDATMKDPGFVALTSQSRLEVDPSTGEQTEGILKKAYATSPEAIAQARKLIE